MTAKVYGVIFYLLASLALGLVALNVVTDQQVFSSSWFAMLFSLLATVIWYHYGEYLDWEKKVLGEVL